MFVVLYVKVNNLAMRGQEIVNDILLIFKICCHSVSIPPLFSQKGDIHFVYGESVGWPASLPCV